METDEIINYRQLRKQLSVTEIDELVFFGFLNPITFRSRPQSWKFTKKNAEEAIKYSGLKTLLYNNQLANKIEREWR